MTRLRANALLALAALFWGTGNVAQKTVLEDLGPFMTFGLRCSIAAVVIAPLVRREARASSRLSDRGWRAIAEASCFFCLALGFQQYAYGGTSVTNASFLVNTTVVFTPILAWIMMRERLDAMTWPCIAMVLAGVFMMGRAWTGLGWGDACCLASALLYSAWIVLVARASRLQERPFALAASQFGLAAVVGVTIGLGTEGCSLRALSGAAPELLILGLLSTAAAFTLQALAQAATPATDAAIVMSGESIFGAVTAALLLDERPSALAVLGAALILVAILLVQLPALWPSLASWRAERTGGSRQQRAYKEGLP